MAPFSSLGHPELFPSLPSGRHAVTNPSFEFCRGARQGPRALPTALGYAKDKELPEVVRGVAQDPHSITTMATHYPGADVMNQSLWRKNGANLGLWPEEERHYKGPRLGEYARPLIMNKNILGFPNQAPVPLSASEDELGLMAQSSSSALRAKNDAEYAQDQAVKAETFFKLAQARARALFGPDPPVIVKPTADVYPMYSASAAALAAVVELLIPMTSTGNGKTSTGCGWQFL
eukprot:TRINITY_DN111453_c0_g1_i1.p1 TRINITY_DN111453_c0_g1~~TRINITY_DN111453_c0_g1_i1.p1  ORF type:complete len:241 (-),score=53.11 TRINITY_DN111453_c0_g1_i1:12-710(-)